MTTPPVRTPYRRRSWLFALVVAALAAGTVGTGAGALSAASALQRSAVPTLAEGEVLPNVVSADWLVDNLDNPDVVVIEVSTEPGLFERGHIPGAINLRWHTDLVDTVRRDLIDKESLQTLLQGAGVGEGSTIVLYGDRNNWFAAWGAWVFNLYGLENVKLLDGGRSLWEAEARELAVAPESPAAGDVVLSDADPALRAFLPEVLEVVETDAAVDLVDIRSADEFSGAIIAPEGIQELSVRAGHIPGAVNVVWGKAVNEDGTFKTLEELQAIYGEVGVDGSKPIITYCRIGERASHTWFVLSQILGYDAAVYDGSWTEWGNTVGVPIENPAGTIWGGV